MSPVEEKLEASLLDQKWGRLFDSEGKPTQRLGCFLRGLANHIVGIHVGHPNWKAC